MQQLIFHTLPVVASLGLASLALALGGCVGDDRDDAADTTATTSGDTGTTAAISASATSTDATATVGTTVGTATSTDTATAGTAVGTTGDAGSIAESCEVACMNLVGCFPDTYETMAECVAFCIEDATPEPDPACQAATVAFNECLGGASCRDLESEVCEAEFVALEGACGGGEDVCSIAAGGDAGSCGISETCPDSSRALECEGELCRCFEGRAEVATCPNDVCMDEIDHDTLSQKALACCGWEL